MPKITKNVFIAEEVLNQIFADQDSENPGDPSDSLDFEEEENAADEAVIYAEPDDTSELGPLKKDVQYVQAMV